MPTRRRRPRSTQDNERARAEEAAALVALSSVTGDVRMRALTEADRVDKVIRLLSGTENYIPDCIIHLEAVAAALRAFHANAHVL
jgi:hypothetical protein